MDTTIQREKLEQAQGILEEQGIDCWLTFARESSQTRDPALELIFGADVTWQSAFLLTRDGKRIALVGGPDGTLVRKSELYPTVSTYDEGIAPLLRQVIGELDPARIAINYSLGDTAADGLTHGMYLQLVDALAPTPYGSRLESAAQIVAALRARKTSAELARMRKAVAITEGLLAMVTRFLRPGRTEREVGDMLHDELRRRGLGSSWDWNSCPAVNAGASSPAGHGEPGDIAMQPGDLVHIDFGIKIDEYCSDLQRVWYLASKEEPRPPQSVQRAFEACVGAIEAARNVLKPGMPGWRVDEAARSYLVAAGYPEYKHAFGHNVGRACHDGGPLLGPRWPRYGETPERLVEPNSVYAIELGTATERGYIGLEDEVLVTDQGATYLSSAQQTLMLVDEVS